MARESPTVAKGSPKPSAVGGLVMAEWGVAALLTLAAVMLHVHRSRLAGALWRDEVSTLNLATLPTLGDLWRSLKYDSFPIGPSLVIRAWAGLFGGDDASIRTYGLVVGLLSVGVVWGAGLATRRRAPLLTLALFALNLYAIRVGDSLRPHGLAMIADVLLVAAMARWVDSPGRRRFMVATLAAVGAVQLSYHNAILIFALCVAAAIVTSMRRSRMTGLASLGIGVAPAVSLVVYIDAIRTAGDWAQLNISTVTLGGTLGGALKLLRDSSPWTPWLAGLALVAAAAAGRVERRAAPPAPPGDDPRDFAWFVLLLSTPIYFAAVHRLRMPAQPWYFLPWLAVAAPCLDLLLSGSSLRRFVGLVVAAAAGAASFGPVRAGLAERQTNLHQIAEALGVEAGPNDLIVVKPWYLGLTVHRYYPHPERVMTVPPLDDLALHRFDLVKQRMTEPDPCRPLLEAIEQRLRRGDSVWVIGGIPNLASLPAEARLVSPPPAPHPKTGWSQGTYAVFWDAQLGDLARKHVVSRRALRPPTDFPVNPLEDLYVELLRGWREEPR